MNETLIARLPKFVRGARLVLVVSAVVLGALMIYGRFFAGKTAQRIASPDGNIIAEYRVDTFAPATDAAQSYVDLRTRFSPFRHTVFFGLNYGAQINIRWTNSRDLLITCQNCNNLRRYSMEHKWKDVSIHYVLE